MRTALVLVVALVHAASANPTHGSYRVVPSAEAGEVPKITWLNRCVGGCQVRASTVNDATMGLSVIPNGAIGTSFTLSEFGWGDAEWTGVVACLGRVFSPYAMTFTETQPTADVHYGEAIIAGTPAEIGLSNNEYGGVAPIGEDCLPLDHAISFSFANNYPDPFERVHELCWTAAQEIAHTYGLDHEFVFIDDGTSTCTDPMTYQRDCGGEHYFRNRLATCGEFAARDCRCATRQISHGTFLSRLGPGTPTTTVSIAISNPTDGSTIPDGTTLHVPASADRGISSVDVTLNGYPWFHADGTSFGTIGQPATDYTFTLPPDVPDGVIDIEATARDDLPMTATAKVTVTKGAPCTSADACAEGQLCENGRCFWEAPAGEVGDACSFPQFCIEPRCDTHDGESFCTKACNPTATTSCGTELECVATSKFEGYCWPPSTGGGCCSSSRAAPPWLLGLFVVFALRRRRR